MLSYPFLDLKKQLEKAWSRETSATPDDWTEECPSVGQCAITALLVQEIYGGTIFRCDTTDEGSHYWTYLPGEGHIDLTWDQFDCIDEQILRETAVEKTRSHILSFPGTVERYHLFRKRLLDIAEEE